MDIGYTQFQFLSEPQDICVKEEETAFFPCMYTGTTSLPKWQINNRRYSASALPPLHFYNGSGLLIVSVSSSMNMNQYTYLFENTVPLFSNTAHLFVVQSNSSKLKK